MRARRYASPRLASPSRSAVALLQPPQMAPTLETAIAERLERLRQGLVESDVLVRLLRSQIAQLNPASDDSALLEEERRLRRENAQLCVRVETLRAHLVAIGSTKEPAQPPIVSVKEDIKEITQEKTERNQENSRSHPPSGDGRKGKKQEKKEKKEKKEKRNEEKKSSPAPAAVGCPRCLDRTSLMSFLADLGITDTQVREHPEVFTVETMMPHLVGMAGVIGKNLFLKDKKKRLYLLSARHDVEVRLNDVAKQIGASGGLRLADEALLEEHLGVRQGEVNPFALGNDIGGAVTFLLDRAMLEASHVGFHPMSNAATLSLRIADFQAFLTAVRHSPVLISL